MAASKEASFDWLVNTVSKQKGKKKKTKEPVPGCMYVYVRACTTARVEATAENIHYSIVRQQDSILWRLLQHRKTSKTNLGDAQRDRKKHDWEENES